MKEECGFCIGSFCVLKLYSLAAKGGAFFALGQNNEFLWLRKDKMKKYAEILVKIFTGESTKSGYLYESHKY